MKIHKGGKVVNFFFEKNVQLEHLHETGGGNRMARSIEVATPQLFYAAEIPRLRSE
ncbi:MAG TPA: hypothetical protein PKE26_16780 [Kiritimatiellia bacterium]|nr:hypothetical protein [Kiritimatiellia bacterium]